MPNATITILNRCSKRDQELNTTWRPVDRTPELLRELSFQSGASDCYLPRNGTAYKARKTEFKLATWNIGGILNGYPEDDAVKAAVIETIDADVLALQEVPTLRRHLDLFQERHLKGSPFEYRVLIEGNDHKKNIALLSKMPIRIAYTYREEPIASSKKLWFTRDLLETVIEPFPGWKMRIFIVHLKGGSDSCSRNIRSAEAAAIKRIAKQHLQNNRREPIAIVGDFNALSDSETVKTLTRDPYTFFAPHRLEAKRASNGFHPEGPDHILLSRNMQRHYYVAGSARTMKLGERAHKLSTHLPLMVTIRTFCFG